MICILVYILFNIVEKLVVHMIDVNTQNFYYDPQNISKVFLTPMIPQTHAKSYSGGLHNVLYNRALSEVENWSQDRRYEFLDAMTDLVSKDFSLEEFNRAVKKVKSTLDSMDNFEELKNLRKQFEIMDSEKQNKIFHESFRNLKRDLNELYDENYLLLLKNKDNPENINRYTVLGSAIQLMIDSINGCLEVMSKRSKHYNGAKSINKQFSKMYNVLLMFTLRFASYLLKKIDLETFVGDISVFGYTINTGYGEEDEDFEGIATFKM